MGFGDAIMATGRAKILHETDPSLPIAIGDGRRLSPSEVFDHNPRLATPAMLEAGRPVRWLIDHPGNRPYVDYEATQRLAGVAEPKPFPERGPVIKAMRTWRYRADFAAQPGEIYLTEAERAWARDAIGQVGGNRPLLVIEPSVKPSASPNKAWPYWDILSSRLAADWRIIRLGVHDNPPSRGVAATAIKTPSFRLACAVLARAAAVILPEGGLHHAAAALGIPGVVIIGGYTPVRMTGYGIHVNLWASHPETPCGRRDRCDHCRAAMAEIVPQRVVTALEMSLGRHRGP